LHQHGDHSNLGNVSRAAQAEPHRGSPSTHFAAGYQVDRYTYRAVCDQPKDKDHADLCQQWRMAEAAESQFWLSVLGTLFLLGTLLFTGIAANAARKAARSAKDTADAAIRANELNRDNATVDQRPWLSIRDFKITYLRTSPGDVNRSEIQWLWIGGTYELVNTGKTPALRVANSHIAAGDSLPGGDARIARMMAGLREITERGHGRAVAPKDALTEEFASRIEFLLPPTGMRNTIGLSIAVGVTYAGTASNSILETAQSFIVSQRQAPGVPTPAFLDFLDIQAGLPDLMIQPVGISRMI
jgi:hypothetical protein